MIFLNLNNLSHVEKFLVDGGYSGEGFANQVKDICGSQVEVVKRLFGWLDKFRRLWKDCRRKLSIFAQVLTFVIIAILIGRF